MISVCSDGTNSTKGTSLENSEKSERSLTYCWTYDTPGHLVKPCSLMNKDPDFKPVRDNVLYPHKKKKHIQEMLKDMKEQMNHEVEAMLDNRLPVTNDRLKDDKWTPDTPTPNENLNLNYSTPTVSPIPSDQIDLSLDQQS